MTKETLESEIESHERFAGEDSNKTRLFGTTLDIGKKSNIGNRKA